MRALVTGATGFIGTHLVRRLERPVVLSRNPEKAKRILGDVEAFRWDPVAGPPDPAAFTGVDAVFHLAGDPIASGRWTEARKKTMRESRILGTRHLVEGIARAARRPAVLVSSSAVGYYGDRADELLEESAAPASDYLAALCAGWEREAMKAADLGLRVVTPRTGVVLGDGGALAKMLPPFRMGAGGRLGSGGQWMAWIHIDDLVSLILHAATTASLRGPVNAVAPNPVTNAEFTRTLAEVLHRPAILPVPAFALRLLFGEMAGVLLGSQRAVPRAATKAGFTFSHADLPGALRNILSKKKS